ncbi:hypothetical protein WH47_08744 [Habropoda laboriosa]|uniref:Uncharacterized protein n=1 Tax=Habropoda laboriosa TaxID=597456 RepID=A0A0L7QPF4_9HYME|nr:hypothetical protein WH47_08744 [Habropoda laboriosa]
MKSEHPVRVTKIRFQESNTNFSCFATIQSKVSVVSFAEEVKEHRKRRLLSFDKRLESSLGVD